MILDRLPTIESAEPEPLPLSDPSAFIWRDEHGEARAISRRRSSHLEVIVPGLGKLVLSDGDSRASALLFPGSDPALLLDAYARFALPIFLQARGFEVLHASAVAGRAGVIGFFGASGGGKSTIAAGLASRGFQAWADDTLIIDPPAETVRLPFRHRLRPDAIAALPPLPIEERTPFVRRPLAHLCLLERGGETELSRLPPNDAFVALYRQSLAFDLQLAERNEAMLETYFDLAERIPVHRLRYRPGFADFPDLLTTIEETLLV